MAQVDSEATTNRFHNLSNEQLADQVGAACAMAKGAEATATALKAEFTRRGLKTVTGWQFTVTATEQIAGRLDAAAVRAHLGDAYYRFEKPIVSTVIRTKAVVAVVPAPLASAA